MECVINMNGLFKKKYNIEVFSEEEEVIGYCTETETTYCFNDVSYLIYSLCNIKTPNQIIDYIIDLCELGEKEAGQVKKDVCDFILLLLEQQIIEEQHGY